MIKWKHSPGSEWIPERDIVSKVAIEEYERKLTETSATDDATVCVQWKEYRVHVNNAIDLSKFFFVPSGCVGV